MRALVTTGTARTTRRALAAVGAIVVATALSASHALAGDGSFPTEPAGSPFTSAPSAFSLAIGDYDSDGDQDVAVTNSNPETITIHRGAGDGSFSCQPPCLYQTGFFPVSIAAGDYDGDGILDLATANMDDHNVTVRFGVENGTFPDALTLKGVGAVNHPGSIAAGDFNADANLDLAVANRDSNNISVFYGAGAGTFAEAPGSAYPTGMTPYMVAVGDFNSDGRDDMAIADFGSDDVTVHLASTFAPGYFDLPVAYAAGDGPRAVAVGDFNEDGVLDLAVANHESATVTVRLGAGDGSFATQAPGSPLGAGSGPSSIAVGDFNSDGLEDLAVTNEDVDRVSVRLGAGDGSFPTESPGSPFGTGENPYFAAVADFNSDGNEDLAVANSQGPSFTIRLGAGIPLLAGNLLVNGGAEGAGAAVTGGDAPEVPSWTRGAGAMTYARYSSTGGFPRLLDSGRWEGGMNLFSAGNDDLASALTSASQSVDVTAASSSIDAGLVSARLQADLGGFRATNDAMVVSASFRGDTGQALGSIEIGPVSAGDRRNLTTLLRRAQSAPVPAGTRSIEVTLTATRPSGLVNHAYADNIKLTLDGPEPPPGDGDTTSPDLALSGRKVQNLGRFVRVRALCASEACRVEATGVLVIHKKRRESPLDGLDINGAGGDLAAGAGQRLKLKIPRKARRAATAALAAGAKVQAKITVIATDAAGNASVLERLVRLG